jgi:hypothetical protein
VQRIPAASIFVGGRLLTSMSLATKAWLEFELIVEALQDERQGDAIQRTIDLRRVGFQP